MIYECAALRHRLDHNRNMARALTRAVWRSLTAESQIRVEVATEEIGAFLETMQVTYPDLQGTYTILKRCHQHTLETQPNYSRLDLENVYGDYAAI